MYALLILMTIIVGCAPKVNYSFVLEVPITYEEEKRVADSYPVEPVEIKELYAKCNLCKACRNRFCLHKLLL